MDRLGKYFTPLVATIITIFLSLVSDFILSLPTEITWLTFFIGSIVTVSVTLLELRLFDSMQTEIGNKLQIWHLLDSIKDEELKNLAIKAIDDCEDLIRSYQQGIIPSNVSEYLHNPLRESQKYYRGTFWAPDKNSLYKLEDTFAGRNYVQKTYDAIKRGVQVDRIFIFNQADILNDNSQFVNLKALKIMQAQQKAGVNVRITWIEDWIQFGNVNELHRDFA